MSEESVEAARAYYADIDRTLKAFWASPEVALSASAETQAIIERLHPGVVWKPRFVPQTRVIADLRALDARSMSWWKPSRSGG